ncbi:unnamed protein product [Protopolystoma xenopodis]|uniref:Exportin-T n=1 Tax=Protopolystoma xenopodis TaxID=117903 RepID=A0A3S5B1F1_9PLAT|nr:unnamed protein product [Protopolystoma xenopodis]
MCTDSNIQSQVVYNGTEIDNSKASVLDRLENHVDLAFCFSDHSQIVKFILDYIGLFKGSALSSGNTQATSGIYAVSEGKISSSKSTKCFSGMQSSTILLDITSRPRKLIERLLILAIEKMKYPQGFESRKDNTKFEDTRHEWRTVISNLLQLYPSLVLSAVRQLVAQAASISSVLESSAAQPTTSPKETVMHEHFATAEVALALFYHIGEVIKVGL